MPIEENRTDKKTISIDYMKLEIFILIEIFLALGIFCDSHLDILNPYSLHRFVFVNFQCESIAWHQSTAEDTRVYITSIVYGITRSPAFIHLERDDKLTRIAFVARSGRGSVYVT